MKRIYKELLRSKLNLVMVFITVTASVLGMLALPSGLSAIINNGIPNADTTFIVNQGLIMLGWAVLSLIASVLTGLFASKAAVKMGANLRSQVFSKVQSFSPAEFDSFSTASLITRTNNDITQIQNYIIMFLRIVLMAPIMMIGGIVMSFSKSPSMSLVLIVLLPVLIVAIILIARRAIPLSSQMQGKQDNINLVMREKLTGIRVIRAFGTEEHERKRFLATDADYMQNALKMQRTIALLLPVLMFILNCGTLALLVIGGNNSTIAAAPGDLIAVVQYITLIMVSVMMLCLVFVQYPRAASSAKRIDEVMKTAPTVTNPSDPVTETEVHGQLEFKNVTFAYAGADKPALSDISFTVRPGETLAIIGGTGSGKSTLVNLIPRFYDVTQGTVLLNGVDVRKFDIAALRKQIGYVPQKALLFRGTIASNIKFGDDAADDSRMEHAAAIAQSTDFIMKKPEGFNDPIAQLGSNVSGGQRQRLAITRAIIRKPDVYIFDDSFSALDFKTDAALRAALASETGAAAVVIVAQRISTIMHADNILVLDHGVCVGMGRHEELLNSCETYREIAESQLSEEEMNA